MSNEQVTSRNAQVTLRSRRGALRLVALVALGLLTSVATPQTAAAQASVKPGEVPELFKGCWPMRRFVYSCEKLYIAVADETGRPEKELAAVAAFWTQKSRDPINVGENIHLRLAGKLHKAVQVTQTFRGGNKDVHFLVALPRKRTKSRILHCGVKGAAPTGIDRCKRILEYLARNDPPQLPDQ